MAKYKVSPVSMQTKRSRYFRCVRPAVLWNHPFLLKDLFANVHVIFGFCEQANEYLAG